MSAARRLWRRWVAHLCGVNACALFGCESPDFSRPDVGSTRPPIQDLSFDWGRPEDAERTPDTSPEAGAAPPTAAPSDGPTLPPTDGPTTPPSGASIVGVWVSEGEDVAPLLAGPGVNVVRLDATFNADGTFAASFVDRDDRVVAFTGRFSTETRTVPHRVVLDQETPQAVRSEGIWTLTPIRAGQVSGGDVLRYEIAQTQPPLNGVTAPTPEGGFGSTSGGDFGADNVQTYRRVRP